MLASKKQVNKHVKDTDVSTLDEWIIAGDADAMFSLSRPDIFFFVDVCIVGLIGLALVFGAFPAFRESSLL